MEIHHLRKHSRNVFVFILKLNFFSLQWPDFNNIEILYLLATTRTNHRPLILANRYLQIKEYTARTLSSPSWAHNPISFFVSFTGESSPSYGILKSIIKKKKSVPWSKHLCKAWNEWSKDFTTAGHLRTFTWWGQCASCREEPTSLPTQAYS